MSGIERVMVLSDAASMRGLQTVRRPHGQGFDDRGIEPAVTSHSPKEVCCRGPGPEPRTPCLAATNAPWVSMANRP